MAYLDKNPAPENRNFGQPTYYNFDYIANRVARGIICNPHKTKAPQVGLEPTTLRLTAGCSAIELLRSNGTDGDNFRRRDPQRVAKAETAGQWAFAAPANPD